MPTLEFKGKHIVYAHHLNVPYRLLDVDRKKSLLPKESDGKDGNLIIHGDNLHALKALLPRYGGKVNCVYIDPPYNTGNEGWCYNDNVNSELMQRWLKERRAVDRVVDREDEERHDKWLCMIWPRLQLLRELLADDGVIFASIDDNEAHHLRAIMDQIFDENCFVADITIRSNPRGSQASKHIAVEHERLLIYCKDAGSFSVHGYEKDEADESEYNLSDKSRGKYRLLGLRQRGGAWRRKDRPNLFYPFWVNPLTQEVALNEKSGFSEQVVPARPSGEEGRWTWSKREAEDNLSSLEGKPVKRNGGEVWDIFRKDFLLDESGERATKKVRSIWAEKGLNYQNAGNELKEILGGEVFDYPKPVFFVKKILRMFDWEAPIVLDSFAGSGTTAQAVLELNKEDGGDRKFILVECEDYADSLTAERVRRVIKGVKSAKSETMKNGLGGHFAFCSLGKAIELEALLRGQVLPSYEQMARYAAYVATGAVIDKIKAEPGRDYFFGAHGGYRFHLIYRPDKAFLRGRDSALRFDVAEAISAAARKAGKTALVFAPWKFMSQKDLTAIKVVFCQIPHEVLRLADDADSE